MSTKKALRIHTKETKFKAALAMVAGTKTVQEISKEYGLHQSVLHRWKKDLIEKGPTLFDNKNKRIDPTKEPTHLERKIGQLTMEVDFLKQALKP